MKSSPKLPQSSRSFSASLAIAFFVLCLVAILLSGALLYFSLRTQQDSVSTNLKLVANDAALAVKGFFQEKFASLETFATLITPGTATGDQNTLYVQSLLGQQAAFRRVALIDVQAHKIASASRLSGTAETAMFNRIDPAATAQLKQGNRFVSSVYLDATTNEPLVLLAVPVRNPFGEVVGGVVAELNLKFMWDLVDQLQVGQTGYAFLVDRKGDLLAYHDTSRVLKGENLAQLEQVSQFVKSGAADQASFATVNGIEGQPVAAASVPLGTPDWALVTELPVTEAYGSVRQNAIAGGIVLLAILVLAALAGVALARRLSAPLIALTETASRIADGQLDLQASVKGPSEVSSLAIAFNSMTARLRQTLTGLETRVAERTHELEVSKDELESRNKELEASQQKLEQGQKELAKTNTELQQASQYLNALNDTTLGLIKHLGIEGLLNTIVSRAAGLVQTEHGYLYLSDANQAPMTLRVGTGLYETLIGAQANPGVGLAGQVWQTGKLLAVDDYQNWSERLTGTQRSEIRAAVGVPLKLNDVVVGVLGLAYTEEGRVFGESEIEALNRFAQLAMVALENARLFEQTTTALQETEIIYRATRELSTATDLNSLLKIGAEFGHSFDLPVFSLALREANDSDPTKSRTTIHVAVWNNGQVMYPPEMVSFEEWDVPDSALTLAGNQRLLIMPDLANPSFPIPHGALETMRGFGVRGLVYGKLSGSENEIYGFSSQQPLRNLSDAELLRISSFATQFSTVLLNLRLNEQTQSALSEMRRLNEFSNELNQLTAFESLLEIAARSAFVNGAKSARLLLMEYDNSGNPVTARIVASLDHDPDAPSPVGASYRLEQFPVTRVLFASGDNPVIASDVRTDPRFDAGARAVYERLGDVGSVLLPLSFQGRSLAFFIINWAQAHEFSESEQRLYRLMMAPLALAVNNRLSFQKTEEALKQTVTNAERLRALNDLTTELSRAADLPEIIQIATDKLHDLMREGEPSITLVTEDPALARIYGVRAPQASTELSRALPLAGTVMQASLEERRMIHIPDIRQVNYVDTNEMQNFGIQSVLIVPLIGTGGQHIGTLNLTNTTPTRFSTQDEQLMRQIGAILTAAIENRRLFEQTQTALTEMQRLNAFSTELNQLTSLESLLDIASRSAFQNGAKSARLMLIENDESGKPEYGKIVASIDRNPNAPSPVGSQYRLAEFPVSSLLFRNTDDPIISSDVMNDTRFDLSSRAVFKHLGDLANVFLPLNFQGRWLAFFAINWAEPHEFSPSEERLYRLMISPLALALNNRLSFQKTEEALEETVTNAERLRMLNELSFDLNRAADLDEIIKLATDKFPELMRRSEASLTLLTENPELIRIYGVRDAKAAPTLAQALPLANTAMEASLREHRVVHISDLSKVNYVDTDAMRNFGIQSTLIVPLIGTNNQSYGTLNLTNRSAVPFSSQDQQLMVQLGALLTSAIENRRLFEQTRAALARAQELAERERVAAEQIMALNRRLTSEGWEQFLTQQQGTLWVEDTNNGGNGRGHVMPELARAEQTGLIVSSNTNGHSTLAVPIVVRGEVIGTIGLEDFDSGQEWSEDRMGIINDVVENLGLALDNARLFTETQRRVTELDALNQISQAVSSELDLEQLLTTIGSQLRSIFDVQNAYIALYDRETQTISLPYFVNENERVEVPPIEYGEGLSSEIIRTRKPLLLNQDAQEAMENMSAKVFGSPALSFLGVPIFVGDDVTGVISIQSTTRQGAFDESNIRLLETIAATVGTAIQGAQLYGAMQQEVVTRQRAEEEIKLSLKEKEVLLKEIHHRVKNNLQIITSLLNLQSAQIKDPEAVTLFRDSMSRVRSMALIHEKLYQSKDLARIDFDGYLRDLMIYLFRSYAANPEQIHFHVESHDMYLGIDTAIPCGLMISELVTNTIKYAFPNGRKGNLWISIGPEDDGHLTLLVKDDGVGFKEGFDWRESDSLGLQLVSTLTSQLHGTVDVNGVGGTSFKITFPG